MCVHLAPDKVPDSRDIISVKSPIKRIIIKEVRGIQVWKSNFGSVHTDTSQELTTPEKTHASSALTWVLTRLTISGKLSVTSVNLRLNILTFSLKM